MSFRHHLYTYDGNGPLDITSIVDRYSHDLTRFGPYNARFSLKVDRLSDAELDTFFSTWGMYKLQTIHQGIVVWEGFIWEMTLDVSNIIRRLSAKKLRNKVKVYKLDPDDNSKREYTPWFVNSASINKYGTFEHIEEYDAPGALLDNNGAPYRVEETGALAYDYDWLAQTHVDIFSELQPLYELYTGTGNRTMSVHAVGRQVLAENIKLSDGWISDVEDSSPDGTNLRDSGLLTDPYVSLVHAQPLQVSQEIRRICGVAETQGGWLYAKAISLDNEVTTHAGVSSPVGIITRLRQLAEIPYERITMDSPGMELRVDIDGGVIYEPRRDPKYYYYTNQGLTYPDREPVRYDVEVAPVQVIDPKAVFVHNDGTILPERARVGTDGHVNLSPLEKTSLDSWAAIIENMEWIERSSEEED